MAFEGHMRSRHGAGDKKKSSKNAALAPLLRLKRNFGIKSEKSAGMLLQAEKKSGGYDLLFVTFLRWIFFLYKSHEPRSKEGG